MDNKNLQNSKLKKTPILNIINIVLGGLLIVSVIANIVLVLDDEKPSKVSVCNPSDITKFNEIISATTVSSDDLSGLASEIESRDNWSEDVNCNYIVFNNASSKSDSDKMKSISSKIEELNSEGYSIDGRFDIVKNINTIKSEAEVTSETNGGRG